MADSPKGRGQAPPRLSITIDEDLRRKIRIAAARNDMEPTEWARVVLGTAAKRLVQKLYPNEV